MQPSIIKNFITKETCDAINSYIKPRVQPHPIDEAHPHGKSQLPIFHKNESVFFNQIDVNPDSEGKTIFDILNLIQTSIASKFNLPKDKIKVKGMTYTLCEEGQGLPIHNDWGVSKCDVYSAILYINEDYEGGEIVFYNDVDDKNSGVSYKPESGMLVYFPGTEEYVHEVMKVKSGSRANFVIFFEGTEEKIGAENVKARN
jgi:hypothetical protein